MKICPILAIIQGDSLLATCLEYKCQFWTSAFTTENIEIWDCAFVIMAKKNSDGGIPV